MGIASLVLGIISIIVGFVPLCGAIAFLPAVIGLILGIIDMVKKSKSNEKKGLAIAGIVMCAIAILVIFFWVFIAAAGSGTSNTNTITSLTTSEVTKEETVTEQKDYMEVDYATLYQEYQDNPIAADSKYKNKKIQVTGPVADIDREIAGNTYINFEIGFLQDVRLTFKKSEESKVAQLSKGQTVTVRGICKGTLLSTTVSLTDCELID